MEHIPNVLIIFTNAIQVQDDSLYRILNVARCVSGLTHHGMITHQIGK
jgi:hypothetical protein